MVERLHERDELGIVAPLGQRLLRRVEDRAPLLQRRDATSLSPSNLTRPDSRSISTSVASIVGTNSLMA